MSYYAKPNKNWNVEQKSIKILFIWDINFALIIYFLKLNKFSFKIYLLKINRAYNIL